MIGKNQEMRNINIEDYLLYSRMHIQIKKLCGKNETSIRKITETMSAVYEDIYKGDWL